MNHDPTILHNSVCRAMQRLNRCHAFESLNLFLGLIFSCFNCDYNCDGHIWFYNISPLSYLLNWHASQTNCPLPIYFEMFITRICQAYVLSALNFNSVKSIISVPFGCDSSACRRLSLGFEAVVPFFQSQKFQSF